MMARLNENKGFCMFFDWIEDLKFLPGEDAFTVIEALSAYYKDGVDPVECVPGHLKAIVSMMYHQIQRKEEISATRAENARTTNEKKAAAEASAEKDLRTFADAECTQSDAVRTQCGTTNTNTNTNTNNITISPPIVPPLRGGIDTKTNKKLFAQFWEAYPRKTNKQKAESAFKKLNVTEELLEQILDAIERQKKSDQWTEDGGRYIPHPSTWLNGKRWEDEVTVISEQRVHNSSGNLFREYLEELTVSGGAP